ncbi:hypothetical protein OZX73_06465 [Bifidobacterium sp. ESL0775]|uniref:type IV toxin-antitoxin system AbiEi family antitoxin domain-containing protein n=1 Tax=Bifidobacterium sp. ESL0775 TaxID=2983230 RepID=UPI0023F6886F|nr:hypothetical protein [Bifidobacterium sp. ESL0775]WEV68919.1 hypothetical protein OZX73_06465 [Bifidobacterium sp. ESL0775]
MKRTKELIQLLKDNSGTLSTSEITSAGFSPGFLNYMSEKNLIVNETRGIWSLPEVPIDDLATITRRWKRCVVSYGSALWLHDLTDRTPHVIDLTVPEGYMPRTTHKEFPNIIFHTVIKEKYEIGLSEAKTPAGNIVPAYDKERCICDVLKARNSNNIDIQVFSESLKRYFADPTPDMKKLSNYAKLLHVSNELHRYTEVLL